MSRLLHEPTLRLKDATERDASYHYVQALRELFAIEAGGAAAEPEAAEVTSLEARRRRRSG